MDANRSIETARRISESLHELLTGDDADEFDEDMPDSAAGSQTANFVRHVISLTATKTGDGLADPKLVLTWLLGAMGAPATAIGLLVPLRESLALLPQLFVATWLRKLKRRKWAWVSGSVIQGLSVLGMALATIALPGSMASWAIVALLATFSVARSACSVSYKSILGKTVKKNSRGTATGTAGSAAAILVLVFGLLLSTGIVPLTIPAISASLLVGGGLWLAAAALFSTMDEAPRATAEEPIGMAKTMKQFRLLRQDPQLTRLIMSRGLLTATALAPPFILALGRHAERTSLSSLGPFVAASSLAAIFSSYIWGMLADRSSRLVMIASAFGGFAVLAAMGLGGLLFDHSAIFLSSLPIAVFCLTVFHQGIKLGRSTHLVDMATEGTRSSYTAVSNTIIGVILMLGGVFGVASEYAGPAAILVTLSIMSLSGALVATGLNNVQA